MSINLENYEEFFMLYLDGELTSQQQQEVEAFAAAHPHLNEELQQLKDFKLSPDENIVFANKESLLKDAAGAPLITKANIENLLVLYTDNELNSEERNAVEVFLALQPAYKVILQQLEQVKLLPDTALVFADKEILYRRQEEERRVIPFAWWRMGAAAVIVLLLGLFWLNRSGNTNSDNGGSSIAGTAQKTETVKESIDTLSGKQEQQPVNNTAIAAGENKIEEAGANTHQELKVKSTANKINKQEDTQIYVNQDNPVPDPEPLDQTLALKSSNITMPGEPQLKRAGVNSLKLTAIKPVSNPVIKAVAAVDEVEPADAGEETAILTSSVTQKTPLRGFFRKASRLIAKTTGAGENEGNHKTILIGGFEIAVR